MSPSERLTAARARISELESELARMREDAARHRALFDSMDEGFCIIEVLFDACGAPVDYRFLAANPALERHTGRRDVVGKRVRELEPRIEEHWLQFYGRVALSGRPERLASQTRWFEGRSFEVFAFPVGQPQEHKVAVLFGDVTARKNAEEAQRESERQLHELNDTLEERVAERTHQLFHLAESLETERRRLEAVLDCLPVGVWIVDVDGRLAGKNALGDRIWHGDAPIHDDPDRYAQYDAWDTRDGHKLASEEYPVPVALRTGRSVPPTELRVLRFDGTTGTILVSAAPILDGQGALSGAVAVSLDITERVQGERALRQAHARLRALSTQLAVAEERERQRLADLLHDDLQQTLAAAIFHLDLIRERAPSDEIGAALLEPMGMLREAVDTARSLSAELSPNLLHDTGLEAALQALAYHMEQKHGLRVTVEAADPQDAPLVPEDLRLLLYRTVRELLFNTVKHAGVKAASIRVDRPTPGSVRVTVADDGRGFEPARLCVRTPDDGGGLGLYTVSERLASIGGDVRIDSAPGRGTRITLVVPIDLTSPDGERSGALRRSIPGAEPAMVVAQDELDTEGRIRILLADDHAIVRQGLRRLLNDQPDLIVVGEAEDGEQAVDLAHALHPDVVLMDLAMPRMNGIDATSHISAELPGTRIIGLSMFDEPEKKELMRQAGACDYIPKGGPPGALLAAIRGAGQF